MRRFVILLSFGRHGIDFRFAQDVRSVVSDHSTVADIGENPYDPILGRKRLFEPSAVQTNEFPIHFTVEFHEIFVPRSIEIGFDLTKSSRPGVRADVPPTLVMTDIFPFFVRSIGCSGGDDAHDFS